MKTENTTIKLDDGTSIFTKITYAKGPTDIWLVATHGISEHLGRHGYLPELFGDQLNIFQYDLRGHGNSGGKAAYIHDFFQYMRDLDELLNYLKQHHGMLRYILFGHSMGGLIVSGYLQEYAREDFYPEKVVINAPPVGIPGLLGNIIRIIPTGLIGWFAGMRMSFRIGGLLNLKFLSHDPQVSENYVKDELVSLKLHTRLVFNLLWAQKKVFSDPIGPLCPAWCSVGTQDGLVNVEDLIEYFSNMENRFTLRIVKEAYHEIHNETDQYRKPYFEYLKKVLLKKKVFPVE